MKVILDPQPAIKKLAQELLIDIKSRYANDVTFLIVLDGALLFAADLAKEIQRLLDDTVNLYLETVKVKSYEGTKSTGNIQFLCKPDIERLKNSDIVYVIEDVIDTGQTMQAIGDFLDMHNINYKIVSLFLKERIESEIIKPDFYGYKLPADKFIIGYGLDLNGKYRAFDKIHFIEDK